LWYAFGCAFDDLYQILYGIVGGIFTPTEACDIAVVYAMIIGKLRYKKKIKFKKYSGPLSWIRHEKRSASLMVLGGFRQPIWLYLITGKFLRTYP